MVSLFAPVLEAEQQLPIHPDGFDVVVERTWVGRDVAVLLTCLSGNHKLNPKKKKGLGLSADLLILSRAGLTSPMLGKNSASG